MRAVIQRVRQASVEVDGKIISSIQNGLCVLIGICEGDQEEDKEVKKILNLKLFSDQGNKPWQKSVIESQLELLFVSQFTLYATTKKGNKPDFHLAMKPEEAKMFYLDFLEKCRKQYQSDKIQDGLFGAMMQVNLINDGPVTIQLDSRQK